MLRIGRISLAKSICDANDPGRGQIRLAQRIPQAIDLGEVGLGYNKLCFDYLRLGKMF